ncbi:MAG: protoporphyrinogen oxidase [Gemmatimonadaceae bacterium]
MPSPSITLPNAGRAHVLIVGGGISGLAAAARLAAARRPLRVTLIELADRLGGLIATERTDGFVMEHGPDAVLAAKPAAIELAQRVGIADRLIGMSVRGSYVVSRGRLVRLPEGMSGLVPSRPSALMSTPLLSPAGKARVMLETLVRRRSGDAEESIAQFVVRRLGRETYERVADPLLTGVFAGDGARLSLDATFPRLRALEREHGSVLRGMFAERRRAKPDAARTEVAGVPGSAFLSFRNGMAELPEGVAQWLAGSLRSAFAVEIRLRAPAAALWLRAGGRDGLCVTLANGETLEADAIVLATPAAESARLLATHDAKLGGLLGAIEHASTAAVSLGYPRAGVGRALTASGYTVPRVEQRAPIACTWSSAKFAGRAPEGFVLFRIFFGGVGRDAVLERDDDDLIALARAELAEMLAVRDAPVIARVSRWPNAIPQYTVGHLQRRAEIEARLAGKPWVALAGNALAGVGIADCVRSGERAAEGILDWLGSRESPVVASTNHPF